MSRNFQGVGTGKFKTGCRRRKVIKEDFAGVPIRWFCFRLFNLWSPGELLFRAQDLFWGNSMSWLRTPCDCQVQDFVPYDGGLAWHMHGLPMVRYQFGLLGRGSPKRVRHWLTSSFNDWLGWFSSGYSGFHPPITRGEKNITRDFSIQKREYEYKREYKKRTNRKIIKIKKIFCNI